MRLNSWAFVAICLASTYASAMTVVTIEVTGAAQDGTGRVWAIGRPDNSYACLCVWDGDAWRKADLPSPPAENAYSNPSYLERSPDGWVLCTWEMGGQQSLTRHRGDASELLLFTKEKVEFGPSLMCASNGDLLLSGHRVVYRVPKQGPFEPLQWFDSQQYFPATPLPDGEMPARGAISLLEDSTGRVWFWGKDMPYECWNTPARGIWLYAKGKVERRETIDGIPDRPFGVLVQKDNNTLWLAVNDDGLYEVDVKTLRGTRVPDPEPGALRYVQQIERVGDDWYIIASDRWYLRNDVFDGAVLWRWRDGAWTRLLGGLDALTPRPMLKTKEGLWLGTFDSGLRLLPADGGEARALDWRTGFPLRRVDALFALPDGELLACSTTYEYPHATVAARPEELLAPGQVAPNLEVFKTYCSAVQDAQGRFWMLLRDAPEALGAWDGSSWTRYPLPEGCNSLHVSNLAVDCRGRVWVCSWKEEGLFYYDQEAGPVRILDPATGQWEAHDTYFAALEAQIGGDNDFRLLVGTLPPVLSKDGRIALNMNFMRRYYYFDGKQWRRFTNDDLGEGRAEDLFFNEDGKLVANTHRWTRQSEEVRETWQYDEGEGWHKTPDQSPPKPQASLARKPRAYRPGEEPPSRPEAVIEDAQGAQWYWYAEKGQLCRRGLGLNAAQFTPDERHPFLGGAEVLQAHLDLKGNTVFEVNWRTYVLLRPRLPLPDTSVTVAQDGPAGFTVRLSTTAQGDAWYVWRVDRGAWSKPQQEPDVHFTDLVAGEHPFEAYALDRWLQADPTPATATLRVAVESADQIAGWIEALASANYAERESAVAALVRAGQPALSALKKARESANDDLKWWIDAALQRIEQKR